MSARSNPISRFLHACPPCVALAMLTVLVLLLAGCTAMPIQPSSAATVPASAATALPAEEPTTPITATTPATTTETVTETVTETSATTTTVESTAESAASEHPIAAPVGTPETYDDMPVGYTAEGYLYRGDPDAPVVMFEFSDFQCPFCARYFVQTEPALNESYVKPGTLRVVFRDLPLVELHPNAPAAHYAAACIAEQSAALFWAMHDQLFRTQTVWSNLDDPSPEFARLAGEIGADMDAYNTCIAGDENIQLVQAHLQESLNLGYNGTPTFLFATPVLTETFTLVGAQPYDYFAQTIDSLAAGVVPAAAAPAAESAAQPQAGAEQQAGIPAWASPEGKAVDPNNPGFTVYGDQTRGNPDAPVVIVEYEDFQCPYCQRHHQETQPTIDSEYVDTGKVRVIFKHFPLPMHPQAPAAAVAAECASDQGQFWEMYNLLFDTGDQWAIDDPTPVFVDLAGQLGLDTDAYALCLKDTSIVGRVEADQADGAQYVQGTPTFILLYGDGGKIIPGALPLETFEDELNSILTEIGG